MSESIERLAGMIAESMADYTGIETVDDYLRITTQCLYPSNGLVRVSVRLNGPWAIVSDDRGALNEAQSAGLDVVVPDRSLAHVATRYGAEIKNGTVFAKVPLESVAGTAVFVANASRAVADWMYTHSHFRPIRDFRALLADLLKQKFDNIVHHDVEIEGARKKHKFANLITLPRGHRLLIDPVSREPASMTGRIVAHLDVRDMNDPFLTQRIVYDDTDKWDADSLNLLSIGAVTVPFSRSGEVIDKLSDHG
jgi:hypothetical protein